LAIILTCECGRKLQIKEEYAGQEGKCPACGRTFRIPLESEAEEPPRPLRLKPLDEAPARPEKEPASRRDRPERPEVNHAGGRLSPQVDFFAPPPEEIGPVTSAQSTLQRGKEPWSAGARLVLAGLAGMAGLLLGAVLVFVLRVRSDFWQVVWPFGGGALSLAVALHLTRFRHTCTYVGQEGVARFVCSGRRDRLSTREVFRFRDATELRTSHTLRYVNGVYQNTTYSFRWTDVGGRLRHEIRGTHRSEKGTPPATDSYHFARAAEFAWTGYLLGQVQRQVELAGSVLFNLKGGRWVRLGPGTITFFVDGGEPIECEAAEIAEANVDKGTVRFKRTDAREGWFSSRGVYRFPFDHLANAQLFFHLLDRLVGIRVR
jgi:hypothetical protein